MAEDTTTIKEINAELFKLFVPSPDRDPVKEKEFNELASSIRGRNVTVTCRPQDMYVDYCEPGQNRHYHWENGANHVFKDERMKGDPVFYRCNSRQLVDEEVLRKDTYADFYMRLKARINTEADKTALSEMLKALGSRGEVRDKIYHVYNILQNHRPESETQVKQLKAEHSGLVAEVNRTGIIQVTGLVGFDTIHCGSGRRMEEGLGYLHLNPHILVKAVRNL